MKKTKKSKKYAAGFEGIRRGFTKSAIFYPNIEQ